VAVNSTYRLVELIDLLASENGLVIGKNGGKRYGKNSAFDSFGRFYPLR